MNHIVTYGKFIAVVFIVIKTPDIKNATSTTIIFKYCLNAEQNML